MAMATDCSRGDLMRNLPLFMQIWLVFVSLALVISLLLAILFPLALRDFFTEELYETIENAQSAQFTAQQARLESNRSMVRGQGMQGQSMRGMGMSEMQNMMTDRMQQMESIRTVNHIYFVDGKMTVNASDIDLPSAVLQMFVTSAAQQTINNNSNATEQAFEAQLSNRGSAEVDERLLFYIVDKRMIADQELAIVSFMWDAYRDDLAAALFRQLAIIMSFVFVLSLVPAILMAKHLTKPLAQLNVHVHKLAERKWEEPIELERKDEIGKLGEAIESLRQQIISQDQAQQSLIQHTSHELKTPVMVIRSYAQALADGIYPQGDLSSTVQVIEKEAQRLEKRIRDLLYITKLDYLATQNKQQAQFDLAELIRAVVDRLRWQRTEINWSLQLDSLIVTGDREQWQVALENILDNQIRYAKSTIFIEINKTKAATSDKISNKIVIANDGELIEAAIMDKIFQQFTKGARGEFGLGLTIAQKIIKMHGAEITVNNKNATRAEFVIRL